MFGDRLEPLAAELKWLAAALGPVRDLDVLIEHLTGEVSRLGIDGEQAEPLLAELGRERDAQRQALAAVLDSERYLQLPALFAEALEALRRHRAKGRLDKLAADEFDKLDRAAKRHTIRRVRRAASCASHPGEARSLRSRARGWAAD